MLRHVLIRPVGQGFQRRHAFIRQRLVALHFGKLDQLDCAVLVAANFAHGADGRIQPPPLAHDFLGLFGLIPQLWVLNPRIQLIQTAQRAIPIKRHFDQIQRSIDTVNKGLRIGTHVGNSASVWLELRL